ncbi:MAG TPA: hypothetical protein VFV38_09870 [Ktedonobacteraceae bacterium]|nr:hypothetical protein [Ktedonobacteraceae bacterium]
MQQQQQQGTTIAQKIEIGANIAYTIAFPVMVLLRHRMGYRFISQPRLIISALIFWVAAIFSIAPATPLASSNAFLIILFTLAFLVVGFVQRSLRWRDIKNGVAWHSRSRGVSWLAFLPLNDSTVKRFIDPLVTLLVGLFFALTGLQRLLGIYLIVAACCLFAWEAYDYERSINLMLDQLDALVDSEVISENMEYYQQGAPGQIKQRPLDETAGIPTGVAPDLQAAIEKRRSRRVAPPDNLVIATTTIPAIDHSPGTTT